MAETSELYSAPSDKLVWRCEGKHARPRVSIIIPTKNRSALLLEALRSVLKQTFEDWEAIVVDDGSSDDTYNSVDSLALVDSRVRFISRERQPSGASTCRNIGLSLARGEYVMFLDSDDLLSPRCLERRVAIMELNPEVDFAAFPMRLFNETPGDSNYLWNAFDGQDDFERFLRFDPPWQTVGPIWRKMALENVGFWDERALSWQDWEFHVRALAEGLRYVKTPEPDSFYRRSRPGSLSESSRQRLYKANRTRVLPRVLSQVAGTLRVRNELTPRRRRFLAAHFYRHAFAAGLSQRKALMIWRRAKNSGAVNSIEFLIVMACWLLIGRMPTRFVMWLFPELGLIRSGTMHMKATSALLNGIADRRGDQ